MKRVNIIIPILIFSSIFISFCDIVIASEDYVGVRLGDVFIWEKTYDEEIMKEYHEDYLNYLMDYYFGLDFGSSIEISEGLYKGLSIINEEHEKYFRIYVTENKNLTIQANHTGSTYDFDLDVYTENGDRIGYQNYTKNEVKIVIHTTYTGYYYIVVELWNILSIMYDLQINVTDWVGDYFEPNNNFSEAVTIHNNCIYLDDLECSYGDEDYFQVNCSENIPINIIIDFCNTEGNLDLYFYNSTLDLVAYSNSTSTDSEEISYMSNHFGKYYIMVNNSDFWSIYYNNSYSLTIISSGTCPIYEEDDIEDIVEDMVEDMIEIEGTKLKVVDIDPEKNSKVEVKAKKYESEDIDDDDEWDKIGEIIYNLYDPSTDKCYKKQLITDIIPIGLDWDRLAVEKEEDYNNDYKKCDVSIEVNFFKNGLTAIFDYKYSDMKVYESYREYDNNGVAALKIYKYGGKEFRRETLKDYIPFHVRVISIGGVIIGIITVITIIVLRKRR